jgi:hypothetical protein
MAYPLLALKWLQGMFKDLAFFIASSRSRSYLTNNPVLRLSWKNVKTPSSIPGNRPFAALCFRHSRTLLLSTPKIAAALRFPFSAHRITSCFNFAVYDSLLDF